MRAGMRLLSMMSNDESGHEAPIHDESGHNDESGHEAPIHDESGHNDERVSPLVKQR
jgi:hypothetical protein